MWGKHKYEASWGIKLDPITKKPTAKKDGGVTQVVECLPRRWENQAQEILSYLSQNSELLLNDRKRIRTIEDWLQENIHL
jgi:hypothetical protein